MQKIKIKIGTRKSELARRQTEMVVEKLGEIHGIKKEECQIIPITTDGDKYADKPINQFGGKGVFTKEIENALMKNEIDIAVHSTKDMAAQLPDGLCLAAFLERYDPRDAFVSDIAKNILELPKGAVVGSSSVRRRALINTIRDDLEIVDFRGNVKTRLDKVANKNVDATILAVAGLKRLELENRITDYLDVDEFPPSPCQGAIGVQIRQDDKQTEELVKEINHTNTHLEISLERAFLKALGGSCQTPIGGLAKCKDNKIMFNGMVASMDGGQVYKRQGSCNQDLQNAKELGKNIGEEIRNEAGTQFFHQWTK